MKKILVFFMLITSISVYGQTFGIINTPMKNGLGRTFLTNREKFYDNAKTIDDNALVPLLRLYVELKCDYYSVSKNKDYKIKIDISDKYLHVLEEGSSMLLKTKENKILTLKCIDAGKPYRLYNTHEVTATYRITEDQLKEILNSEIIKIRIVERTTFLDASLCSNIFGTAIRKQKNLIDNAIKEGNLDIYDSF